MGAKRKRAAPAPKKPASASKGGKGAGAGASSSSAAAAADAEGEEDAGGAAAGGGGGGGGALPRGAHKHNALAFLKPENVRDGAGRRPDHPDYDPRTLSVPAPFLRDCTPAMQQWWAFKAANFDTVLLFKMGKARAHAATVRAKSL